MIQGLSNSPDIKHMPFGASSLRQRAGICLLRHSGIVGSGCQPGHLAWESAGHPVLSTGAH